MPALRRVTFLVVLFVLVLSLGTAGAHHRERHEGPRPSPTPSPLEPEETPSEEDDDAAEEDAAPEEGSGRRSGGGAAPGRVPAQEQRSLAVALGADPERVTVGSTTRLAAVVTNSGDVALDAVELRIELPAELTFRSSTPEATVSGAAVTFALGDLEPGTSGAAAVVAEAARTTPAVGREIVAIATAEGATATGSTTVVVVAEDEAAGPLQVRTRSRQLLAQVGDRVNYVVTVSNESNEALRDVVVVDLVPAEIDVLGVDLVDEVDAVQFGTHRGAEDIVWVIDRLEAGASVALPWTGQVAKAGDLEAVNEVTAKSDESPPARDENSTYLAAVLGLRVDQPPVAPVLERVTTFARVPMLRTPDGSLLPLTGMDPMPYLGLALALVVLGVALVIAAPSRRRQVALLAVLCFTMTACTATEPTAPPDASAPRAEPSATPEDDDEVLGSRIERDEEDAAEPDAADEPTSEDAGAPPAPAPAPEGTVVVQTVRRVEVVELAPDELPVIALDDRAGDNTVTYEWDEQTRTMSGAASSRLLVQGALTELLTNVSVRGGAIDVELVLRNLTSDRRVSVRGRLLHRVLAASGPVTTLESEPLDVTLGPGGETSVRFSYLLPDGSYTAEAAFDSSA